MKKTILKNGLIRRSNKHDAEGGELDLDNWFKRISGIFGIPYVDPCCTVPDNVPVSFNTTSDTLEQWDSTTSAYVPITQLTVDGRVETNGGITDTTNEMIVPFIPLETAQQTLTGAGAVNVTSYLTNLVSTGAAQAITLADGTVIGQLKKIVHMTDGGSMVLTPVSLIGGTTITFTTVGEFVTLVWNGTDWICAERGNTATPGTLPAIA